MSGRAGVGPREQAKKDGLGALQRKMTARGVAEGVDILHP